MSIFRLPLVLVCVLQLAGCQLYEFAAIQLNNQMVEPVWGAPDQQSTVGLSLLHNLPMVAVNVNGKPMRFVVDTGASVSVMLETAATRELSLNKVGEMPISGAGEGFESVAHVVDGVSIEVGTVALKDLRIVYIPFSQIALFDHPDEVFFDGIIGIDVLKKFVVKFDYDEMNFQLAAPDHLFVTDGWHEAELDFDGATPFLKLEMRYTRDADPVQIELLLDTGSSEYLALKVNPEKNIALPMTYVPSTGVGVTGEITSRLTTLEYLEIGDQQLGSLPVSLTVAGGPEDSKDGVLGNQTLSRFNQVYDFQQERVWLQANHNLNQPALLTRTGLGLLPHPKGALVKRITPGSAAEIHGFVSGDLITSVNGIDISQDNYDRLRHAMNHPDQATANLCWQRKDERQCGSLALFVPYTTESASQ
ncbi:MAG: putative aspartyl protease [Candidatus Azotimanducaceae bacterium]|jgi:predicted aspartyl protease